MAKPKLLQSTDGKILSHIQSQLRRAEMSKVKDPMLVAEIILTQESTVVDFKDLPPISEVGGWYLTAEVNIASNHSVTNPHMLLYLNGDTSNTGYAYSNWTGTAVSGSTNVAPWIAQLIGGGYSTFVDIDIDLMSPTNYPCARARCIKMQSNYTPNMELYNVTKETATDDITQITLKTEDATNGPFNKGSRFRLYRRIF